MNRFIINLRSLDTGGPSQSGLRWSQSSTLTLRMPKLSLGNIGEDLQEGYQSATGVVDDEHGTSIELHKMQDLPGLDEINFAYNFSALHVSTPYYRVPMHELTPHDG